MTLKVLLEFINEQNEYFRTRDPHGDNERSRVLARMVKLSEETGELADAILSLQGDQRQEKLGHNAQLTISEEIADVLIVTMLLAVTLNVDVPKALETKIAKIRKRQEGR